MRDRVSVESGTNDQPIRPAARAPFPLRLELAISTSAELAQPPALFIVAIKLSWLADSSSADSPSVVKRADKQTDLRRVGHRWIFLSSLPTSRIHF
jgi:hypothetical protein